MIEEPDFTERLLPQSPDAERGLLSSFLIDPQAVGTLCAERKISRAHFFVPRHASIFAVLLEMWSADRPIDFILLTQILRDREMLDASGGAAFVTELFTFLPTAANAAYYAEILSEKLILRQIITTCTEYGNRSYSEQDNFPAILAEMQAKISAIGVHSAAKVPSMRENVLQVICGLQGRASADGPNLIRTGLKAIDDDVGPLERGDLLVIGGQGKSGKSQLAGQIALNLGFDGKPVLFFSLEMSAPQITARWLASMARVNTRTPHVWSEADHARFAAAQQTILGLPLTVMCGRTEICEIAATSRQYAARPGAPLSAIVLDYAQLTSGMQNSRDDRKSREIADISVQCKRLAVKLDVLFILLTQLNDDGRSKESRGIENDANLMLEVGHNKESGDRRVKVVLARSAPMGQKLKLRFIAEHTRVEDDETMETDEPPTQTRYSKPKRNWHK